jgi:hypothetical protein
MELGSVTLKINNQHTHKSLPENQTKRGEIKNLESFSLLFLFEKNRFPGDPQKCKKHFRNSGRFGPLALELWHPNLRIGAGDCK